MAGRIAKAISGEPLHLPIDDAAFPGLTVHTGAPYVVEGPAVGRIELDERAKTVRAGASEGTLRPPKGVGRRAADNASVVLDGRRVELAHHRAKAARILVDGTPVGELKRTAKRHRGTRPNDREAYRVEWAPGVDARVAGLGHALASRYGVGAPGAGRRALETFGDVLST